MGSDPLSDRMLAFIEGEGVGCSHMRRHPSRIPGLYAITTDEAKDVVILPNRVMRLDRQSGDTYVERIEDNVPKRVNLTLGLRNEQFSEVLEGVEEGDELAIRRTDSGEVLRQQFFGG